MNTAVRGGRDNALPRQNGMKYNENEKFMMKSVTLSLVRSAANAFDFGGPVLCDAHHYGEGHINDTFVVWAGRSFQTLYFAAHQHRYLY